MSTDILSDQLMTISAFCVACRESVVLQETSRRHWTSR